MVDVSSPEVLKTSKFRGINMNETNKTNNKQEEKLLRIEIADASGHQTLMLTPEETQEFVEQQDNKWIFVDNTLIREEDLNSVNWSEADSVRVMPGLVGGATKLIRIEIADKTGHQTLMPLQSKHKSSLNSRTTNGYSLTTCWSVKVTCMP